MSSLKKKEGFEIEMKLRARSEMLRETFQIVYKVAEAENTAKLPAVTM